MFWGDNMLSRLGFASLGLAVGFVVAFGVVVLINCTVNVFRNKANRVDGGPGDYVLIWATLFSTLVGTITAVVTWFYYPSYFG